MAAPASNQMPLLWHPQMDELVAIGVEFLPGADVSLHDFYESLEHEHQYNIDGTHRKIFPTGIIRNKANSKRQVALRSKKRQTNWETPTFSEELYSWIRQNDIIDRLYAFANNLPLPQANDEDTMSNNNQNNERTGSRVRFDNEQRFQGNLSGGEGGGGVQDVTDRFSALTTGRRGNPTSTPNADGIVWLKDPPEYVLLEQGVSRIIKGLTTVVGANRMKDDQTGKKPSLFLSMVMANWEDRKLVSTMIYMCAHPSCLH